MRPSDSRLDNAYRNEVDRLDAAMEEGVISGEEYSERMCEIRNEYDRLQNANDDNL